MKSAWLVLVSVALLPDMSKDQATITVVRTDFEQGIDYGMNWTEPVATANVKCLMDRWKKMINWDYPAGSFEDLLQPVEDHKLYSRKVFSSQGTHQVVAKAWVHCKDSPKEWTDVVDSLPPKTIHVWPRVPVKTADFSASPLKGGKSASLHLVLSAPAPPSGTRVSLTSSDPNLLTLRGLLVDDKGSFITIPPRRTETVVELQTSPVTAAKSVKVSAATSSTVAATLKLIP
jgi:hypothetical protein